LRLVQLAAKGSLFLTRPTLAHYTATRDELVATANDLFDVVQKGAVKIHVNQTYPLKEAAQAHRDLESRKTTGSTVLLTVGSFGPVILRMVSVQFVRLRSSVRRYKGRGLCQSLSLSCFVIGPIGNELAAIGSPERVRYEMAVEIWEKIIQPACFGHDLSPIRADTVARPGEILNKCFPSSGTPDLLVADVYGRERKCDV